MVCSSTISLPADASVTRNQSIGSANFDTISNVDLSQKNLADLLEAKSVTWKSYNENYSQLTTSPDCNLTATIGSQICPNSGLTRNTNLYARKHEPFISFTDFQSSAARCNKIVPVTQLATDITANAVAQVCWYIPNQCNDGHDTGVTYAGKWMNTFMSTCTGNAVTGRTMVVLTFDENSGTAGNQILTILVPFGSMAMTGRRQLRQHQLLSLQSAQDH